MDGDSEVLGAEGEEEGRGRFGERSRDRGLQSLPVLGASALAPTAAAGVGAAAVAVLDGSEDVGVPLDGAFFLRRLKRPLRPFFTWASASGAAMACLVNYTRT